MKRSLRLVLLLVLDLLALPCSLLPSAERGALFSSGTGISCRQRGRVCPCVMRMHIFQVKACGDRRCVHPLAAERSGSMFGIAWADELTARLPREVLMIDCTARFSSLGSDLMRELSSLPAACLKVPHCRDQHQLSTVRPGGLLAPLDT